MAVVYGSEVAAAAGAAAAVWPAAGTRRCWSEEERLFGLNVRAWQDGGG